MIQISLKHRLSRLLARLGSGEIAITCSPSACQDWLRDPLSHPTLSAMSLTELADLPAAALRSCCRQ